MSASRSHNTASGRLDDGADQADNRMLRADAERNKVRILAAARELFARDGIDVPLASIAQQAGVGVATLYRRFPTRNDLISAAFVEESKRCVDVVQRSLDDSDPWHGICVLVSTVCSMQAVDQGFNRVLASHLPGLTDDEQSDYLFALESLDRLVKAAHAERQLRPGITGTDILLIVLANSGVVSRDPRRSLAASRRLVAHLLTAIGAADVALPHAVGETGLDELLRERLG
ncbi:TetR/AcrR family transcriptional regulator [Paramicrobacterium fandaimingii]|uniref:TetR/AcrR family transcriptional regulator n=1 Tax=Paramicrobacterium fandaimingii TaxID=2708079 RepID=UPI001423E873|nr:TetR/AcrR family transcriptional regulator [Microbacterium fandaimingii]